jgi:hypothetical protein
MSGSTREPGCRNPPRMVMSGKPTRSSHTFEGWPQKRRKMPGSRHPSGLQSATYHGESSIPLRSEAPVSLSGPIGDDPLQSSALVLAFVEAFGVIRVHAAELISLAVPSRLRVLLRPTDLGSKKVGVQQLLAVDELVDHLFRYAVSSLYSDFLPLQLREGGLASVVAHLKWISILSSNTKSH